LFDLVCDTSPIQLLDAKKAGLVKAVRPLLETLQSLKFSLASRTLEAVLRLAGEGE